MSTPTTPSGFAEASTVRAVGNGVFHWDVSDGWQQGRGAFGGLVLGTMVRALEAVTDDPTRPLRALLGEITTPVLAGPAEIRVDVLRRGRGITYLDARLVQNGEIAARASGTFAAARKANAPAIPQQPPTFPPWTEITPLPIFPPFGPVFAQHYQHRNVGPMIYSGGKEAVIEGWIREKHPPEHLDAAAMVGLADAWWPSVYSVLSEPRPASTVTFAMELVANPMDHPAEEPLAYTSRTVAAMDGYTVEFRELWSGDKRMALNQQTFALLG